MIRLTVPFTDDTLPPDFNYNLENEPSQCIGLLPKPGCGSQPEQAGDRGGGLQYAVFALIIAGLAIIFTVVFRRVIRGDRAKAERARAERTTADSTQAEKTQAERAR